MSSNYPPGVTGSEPQIVGEPDPGFVDVHVTLDWVIRVRGEDLDEETAKSIATDYVSDQSLESLVEVLVHEDGVLCEGEWMTAATDENGDLMESELTVELWPDDATLPTESDVAVATYHPLLPELRS